MTAPSWDAPFGLAGYRWPAVARRATALMAAAEVERRLSAWHAPTLFFHGTADTYADPKGSERLVAGIASADKELLLVPNGRHELLNDLPRDEVLAAVPGWLERRLP